MVGGVPDVITCAKFQIEIFMGYDFTVGRICDFPIDFSMGLITVQRYCAACDTVFFSVTRTGRTVALILTLNGSNDMGDVIWGKYSPKTPQKGA